MDRHSQFLPARFAADERGATAIEYSLIAAGIAAAIVGTVYSAGESVKGLYEKITNEWK
jgi:pilus assembly protein Flp/PilA